MFAVIFGAVIGLKTGGVFGMLFGGLTVYYIQLAIFGTPAEKRQRIQIEFFKALFISVGKVAKADGVISNNEINQCEKLFQKMNLGSEQRKEAISLFNYGKQTDSDLREPLKQLHQASRGSFSIKQMFMEMLLEVVDNNHIHPSEWQVLLKICNELHFPQNIFVALVKMRGFNFRQNQQQSWQRKTTEKNPFVILGVKPTDSKAVIRKAYKKLMSANHPDKLIAKGLPAEMVNIAKEKTQEIQAAWEQIKKTIR